VRATAALGPITAMEWIDFAIGKHIAGVLEQHDTLGRGGARHDPLLGRVDRSAAGMRACRTGRR